MWCYEIYLCCIHFALRGRLHTLMSKNSQLAVVEGMEKIDGDHNFFLCDRGLLWSTFRFSLLSSIPTKQVLSQKADTLWILYQSFCFVAGKKLNEGRKVSLLIDWQKMAMPSCNCLLDVIVQSHWLGKPVLPDPWLYSISCVAEVQFMAWMKEQYVVRSLVNMEKKKSRRFC